MDRYQDLVTRLRRNATLESCGSVLNWEQETMMPPGGAELRAEQLSLLAGLAHDWNTSSELGDLLEQLSDQTSSDSHDPQAVNIREAKREYDRQTKLPRRLVEELSRVTSLAQQQWAQAKKKSDFKSFEPWLQQVIELKREEAACFAENSESLYDGLLDAYEPGMTSEQVKKTFEPLRDQLVELVAKILDSKQHQEENVLTRNYPKQTQQVFAEAAARKIGFDFERGRIDESAHPFCSGFGPGDCRLTTRYDEHFFSMAFFGTLHEAGHGIYEQGLNPDAFGLPMGKAVSLGIHESQSRLWENLVGRSRPFWRHFYPEAVAAFPETLSGVSIDDFYRDINRVEQSEIRVEADEVTYNLHIMLRFELELMLIEGDLNAKEVPAVWNERFEQFFGKRPSDDAHGCMQDVHWSAGLIGYFPTYALGNIFACQFFNAAHREIDGLEQQIASGEFGNLKSWLNKSIHERGQQYSALELVEHVTGNPFDSQPLMDHLWTKFGEVYGIER